MTVTLSFQRLAGTLLAIALWVGGSQSHAQATAAGYRTSLNFGATYALSDSNHTDTTKFWMQGGAIDAQASLFGNIGFKVAATRLSATGAGAVYAPLDLFTITFGPTYTRHLSEHLSGFGEALIGKAYGSNSLFATGVDSSGQFVGVTSSASSLAFEAGGGAEFFLTRHIGLRAVQVDYLRTTLPNAGTNVQNNLRFAAGVVYRLTRE